VSTEPPILDGTAPDPAPPSAEPPARVSRGEIWLQRIKAGITVIFFIEVGMVLAVVPWSSKLWDDNKLLIMHPAWRTFLMHGFTRGAISGLGLINVWIGIWEAVHYTEKA
jgi:hypothetical protein